MGKMFSPLFVVAFGSIFLILAGNDDIYYSFDMFKFRPDLISDYEEHCSESLKYLITLFIVAIDPIPF